LLGILGVGWLVVEEELVVLAAAPILFVAVEVVEVESELEVAVPVAPPTKVKSELLRVAAAAVLLLLLLLLPKAEEEPSLQYPSAVHVVPVGQQPPPRSLAHLKRPAEQALVLEFFEHFLSAVHVVPSGQQPPPSASVHTK
jgi:hypothetical protein